MYNLSLPIYIYVYIVYNGDLAIHTSGYIYIYTTIFTISDPCTHMHGAM